MPSTPPAIDADANRRGPALRPWRSRRTLADPTRWIAAALAAFAMLFAAVRAERTAAFDLALTLRLQARRSRALARLMRVVSWPGFPPQSRLIPPLVIAAWLAIGASVTAACQLLAWGGALLSTLVKSAVRRERPMPPQVQVVVAPLGGTSFPSGHVLTYTTFYGFLAYGVGSRAGTRGPARLLVAGLLALVGLVGPSRIQQGHHWPTDVTASYLLGLAYLLGLVRLHRFAQARLLRWLGPKEPTPA